MTRQKKWLTLKEASQHAQKSIRTIQRLAKRNANTAHIKSQNGETLIAFKLIADTYGKPRDTPATNDATTRDNVATHDARIENELRARIASLEATEQRLNKQIEYHQNQNNSLIDALDKQQEQNSKLTQLLAVEKQEKLQLVEDTRKAKRRWFIWGKK